VSVKPPGKTAFRALRARQTRIRPSRRRWKRRGPKRASTLPGEAVSLYDEWNRRAKTEIPDKRRAEMEHKAERVYNLLKKSFAEHPKRYYAIFLVLLFLAGLGLSVLAAKLSRWPLFAEILHELGIAFMIAVILAIVIETYALLKFGRELGVDVLAAVFQRHVPNRVRKNSGSK
jgi:hypothetical protein